MIEGLEETWVVVWSTFKLVLLQGVNSSSLCYPFLPFFTNNYKDDLAENDLS